MTVRRRWATALLAIILVLAGGALALCRSPYGVALLKSREHFVANELTENVLYEPGMEREAALVAEALTGSVAAVEREQHLSMRYPFNVYVCASQRSFNEYMGAQEGARAQGVKVRNDIFLSPLAFSGEIDDTYRGVLTHELSHLHLYQRMGHRRTLWDTPPWFLEGLAVMVSGTGGRNVTERDAREAILSGYHFEPDDSGSLLRPRRAADYGVETFMFYRQSELFVRHLRDVHGDAFEGFLLSLQQGGGDFASAFERAFGTDVSGAWEEFESSLRS